MTTRHDGRGIDDAVTAKRPLQCTARGGLAVLLLLALSAVAQAEAPVKLRVLTWNVWGVPLVSTHLQARMRALPDAIAALEPDVILLQELWQKDHGELVARGLERHGYPFTHHFATTPQGKTGLFIAARWPLGAATYRAFAIGRLPHSFWHLDWLVSKGIAACVLETPLGPVLVENTHLQAQYVTDTYAAERLSQASEIVILDRSELGRPLVLGGDFNSTASDLARTILHTSAGFSDAQQSPAPDTVYVRDGGAMTILIREVRSALDEPRLLDDGARTPLSDHAAVIVDLELRRDGAIPLQRHPDPSAQAATASALRAAAGRTWGRVTRATAVALALLGLAVFLSRRRPRPILRFAGFALVATGLVWSTYLAAIYYPRWGATLRAVAARLEAPDVNR
jgi:endonuclease/exonuclease/phosphatase family metal-dependent hydrolase